MSRTRTLDRFSERQKLLLGAIAFLLGAALVGLLGTLGVASDASAMALGVVAVACLVVGTLSVGVSESVRV